MLPNRLEVAKNTLIDFLDTRKNDRVWLVLFSLRPFTSLPLNFDYNISKKIINRVNVDIINNQNLIWTWIGEWLILAADNLKDSDRTKVIILITDWSPSWNNIINPIIATKFINEKYKDNKIKIYTIWIWWDKDIFLERSWGYIKGVDSELLTNISNLTNWKYYNARDKIELNSIFKEISNLEKTDIEIDTKETIKSQSKYFTYVLSFLLLLLLLIKARKYIYNR
jgi:Ca-activated chloride channel family protein